MRALTPVELAEQVASLAREIGIETALVGAYALAVHRYVRATTDIDLGVATDLEHLRALLSAVERAGFSAHLKLPENDDRVGGRIQVWSEIDEDGAPLMPLDVLNFTKPLRVSPAGAAIANAFILDEVSALRCPQLADLVALKLDADGPQDRMDVVNVLIANPGADLDEIRALCKSYGLGHIDQLIEVANAQRR